MEAPPRPGHLVGNGPLEAELKEKAGSIPGNLFLDFQNQSRMPVVYRLADVFILSSRSETWGLGANEAHGLRLRIDAFFPSRRCSGLIREDVNGIVFPVGDYEKCTKFVQELLADGGEAGKDKNGLLAYVGEHFSSKGSYDQWRIYVNELQNMLPRSLQKLKLAPGVIGLAATLLFGVLVFDNAIYLFCCILAVYAILGLLFRKNTPRNGGICLRAPMGPGDHLCDLDEYGQ